MDSATKESYLWFRKCGPNILPPEMKRFLTMSASVQGDANKKHRLTWHEKHMGKRGSIQVSDASGAVDIQCTVEVEVRKFLGCD